MKNKDIRLGQSQSNVSTPRNDSMTLNMKKRWHCVTMPFRFFRNFSWIDLYHKEVLSTSAPGLNLRPHSATYKTLAILFQPWNESLSRLRYTDRFSFLLTAFSTLHPSPGDANSQFWYESCGTSRSSFYYKDKKNTITEYKLSHFSNFSAFAFLNWSLQVKQHIFSIQFCCNKCESSCCDGVSIVLVDVVWKLAVYSADSTGPDWKVSLCLQQKQLKKKKKKEKEKI